MLLAKKVKRFPAPCLGGKKADKFYTPQKISTILSKMVSLNSQINNVSTYNLVRMSRKTELFYLTIIQWVKTMFVSSLKLQFVKTKPNLFTKLKAYNKSLTEGEHRICAIHVSNLHSKEMSAITDQQTRSIYTLKSRIRKKLAVQDDDEMLEITKKKTLE